MKYLNASITSSGEFSLSTSITEDLSRSGFTLRISLPEDLEGHSHSLLVMTPVKRQIFRKSPAEVVGEDGSYIDLLFRNVDVAVANGSYFVRYSDGASVETSHWLLFTLNNVKTTPDIVEASVKLVIFQEDLQDLHYETKTGKYSYINKAGESVVIDLPAEDVPSTIEFDDETNELVFYLQDGSERRVEVPLGDYYKKTEVDAITPMRLIKSTLDGNLSIGGKLSNADIKLPDGMNQLEITILFISAAMDDSSTFIWGNNGTVDMDAFHLSADCASFRMTLTFSIDPMYMSLYGSSDVPFQQYDDQGLPFSTPVNKFMSQWGTASHNWFVQINSMYPVSVYQIGEIRYISYE